jgi:GTP-binding protein EngB required for normal cell division
MSALVETVRGLVTRGTDTASRVAGLERAVEAAQGRLPDSVVAPARIVVERAEARLRHSGEHTVVGLAGATGSGKSSLFNALCGLDLAGVGVKRPTTSWALACAWGPDGANELLDWLEIPPRHQVSRMSMLDENPSDLELRGLVLLDLPDHDSTEVSHHLEVDRLVRLADVLVWVLDPQKYADAAIHDRYFKPFAAHSQVIVVVLNQTDLLLPEQVRSCVADVRRLMAADGLPDVPVLATSALTGDGLDDLRRLVVKRVAAKRSVRDRVSADIRSVAEEMANLTGDAHPADVTRGAKSDLVDAFAEAAAVPVVAEAVHASVLARARATTGWPITKWLAKLRPDPLKRLHLDPADAQDSRPALPTATKVQRARVDTTVRALVDRATHGLPVGWAAATRKASVAGLDELGDALDQAVAQTELGAARTPFWWTAVRVLQWLLFLTAVTGAIWLGALAFSSFLGLSDVNTPDFLGIPVPTWMLAAGVLLGIAVAYGCRFAAGVSGRRSAALAEQRLRSAIAPVCDRLVIEPIETEIDTYRQCRDGLAAALKR